ncbi:YcxB family protein [Sphingomonas sp. ASV193]|uniref:YcxB family protein n=1 Tax=Sphingomonas sp. ASV193 TaxID=3144405 RepID=UPI0032E8F584
MSNETWSAVVEIALGEEIRSAGAAFERIAGNWRRSLAPATFGMAVGLMVAPIVALTATLLAHYFAPQVVKSYFAAHRNDVELIFAIPAGILGWKAGEVRYARRAVDRFISGLSARGAPEKIRTTFEAGPSGIVTHSDCGSVLARWPSILEVWVSGTHVFLQTEGLTLTVPKRAFVTADDERLFFELLSVHLSHNTLKISEIPSLLAAN